MKLFIIKAQIILFIAGCLCTVGCLDKTTKSSNSFLTLQEVREDFYQLTEKIEKEVPNAFYNCDKSDYELVKQKAYNQLTDGMTTQSLYRVLYPLVQYLNDAHFSVHLPDDIMNDSKISYFPIKVLIHNDRLYALEDLSSEPQIKKGEEILFINTISSKEILERIKGTTYQNKRDQLFFEQRNEAVFHRRLYSLFGFTGNFEIKTTDNIYFKNGINAEKLNALPTKDYDFKMLNSGIAYLKINRLTLPQDSLKNTLKNNFNTLKEQSINKLIIDIRGNLGGNSALAKNIFDYFTDTPYTLAVGVDYFSKGKRIHSDTRSQIHNPQTIRDKFQGQVVLISDVLTYSSAHMMQVGFKYHNLGITVGNESSESLYITGEIKQTVLKNSKIELIAPTVNFELLGYSADKKEYYRPDYEIYPSLEDRLNGNDLLLSKALEILN
mgnify:CR=1 FL=1